MKQLISVMKKGPEKCLRWILVILDNSQKTHKLQLLFLTATAVTRIETFHVNTVLMNLAYSGLIR